MQIICEQNVILVKGRTATALPTPRGPNHHTCSEVSVAKSLLLAFREEKIDPNRCAYCGSPWNIGRDHVIPTSYLREKRRYEGDWLVPACSECNSTLGAQLIFNVPDRALWIAATYRKKYARLLKMPHWDDDELEEVSSRLRKEIIAKMRRKAEIVSRIEFVEHVANKPIYYLTSLRPYIEDEDVPEFMDEGETPDFRSILSRARRTKRMSDMQLYNLERSLARKAAAAKRE